MEPSRDIEWPPPLIDAADHGDLAIFVGNGLSRLSGAPAWGKLFEEDPLKRAFAKVDHRNMTYTERADYLEKHHGTLWTEVLRKLSDWSRTAKPSYSHQALHLLFPQVRRHGKFVATSNVDSLLQRTGFAVEDIVHCHGEPDRLDEWIFSTTRYWSAYNTRKIHNNFSTITRSSVLFLGYGHSREDFDIANSVQQLATVGQRSIYTLNSSAEATAVSFRERIEANRINLVTYDIGNEPTRGDRDIFLLNALLRLAEKLKHNSNADRFTDLLRICDDGYQQYLARKRRSPLVLGLCSINKHLQLHGAIPNGGKRQSVRAIINDEVGGPAYIVARILQVTGNNARLLTKVASDQLGQTIIDNITMNNEKSYGIIYTDFIEEADSASMKRGFHTWQSVIIEPNNKDLNRVFVDEDMSVAEMVLSAERTRIVAEEIRRPDTQCILYFDKYFRGGVQDILSNLAAGSDDISECVWTIYETGSDGDRYGRTKQGRDFRPTKAYEVERRIMDPVAYVNIVTSSFRFARDFLAAKLGGLPDEVYNQLKHRDDSDEIRGTGAYTRSEAEVINNLTSVEGAPLYNDFVEALFRGGDQFLRKHDLRVIVVTLHRAGCLIVGLPSSGAFWHEYIRGVPVLGREFNASAGDVFRGMLVSAVSYSQHAGRSATEMMERQFLRRIGSLCNEAASIKVQSETFEKCTPQLRNLFLGWRDAAFGR
jgi:sugar/nucleoside kinase (ribokinase family)